MKLWKLLKNNIPRTSALLHGSRMLKVGVIGAGRGVGTTPHSPAPLTARIKTCGAL